MSSILIAKHALNERKPMRPKLVGLCPLTHQQLWFAAAHEGHQASHPASIDGGSAVAGAGGAADGHVIGR